MFLALLFFIFFLRQIGRAKMKIIERTSAKEAEIFLLLIVHTRIQNAYNN